MEAHQFDWIMAPSSIEKVPFFLRLSYPSIGDSSTSFLFIFFAFKESVLVFVRREKRTATHRDELMNWILFFFNNKTTITIAERRSIMALSSFDLLDFFFVFSSERNKTVSTNCQLTA